MHTLNRKRNFYQGSLNANTWFVLKATTFYYTSGNLWTCVNIRKPFSPTVDVFHYFNLASHLHHLPIPTLHYFLYINPYCKIFLKHLRMSIGVHYN